MEPNALRSSSMELCLLDIVSFHGLLKLRGHSIELTEYSCLFFSSVSNSPLVASITRTCVYHNPLMDSFLVTSKVRIPLMVNKVRVL